MIVSHNFPNDSLRIAGIQHDLYDTALSIILNKASYHYRAAVGVVGIETELFERVISLGFKDHRTLQWFHDAVAARFRYRYVHEPDLFEGIENRQNEQQAIENRWFAFIHQELGRFFEEWPQTSRLICTAAFYPNPDPAGIEAEDKLYYLTLHEYPFLDPQRDMS